MPSTPGLGLPYPPRTGVTPSVPRDLEALAVALDRAVPRGLISWKRRADKAGPATNGSNFLPVGGLSQIITLATPRLIELQLFAQAVSGNAGTTVGAQIWNRTAGAGISAKTTIERANFPQPLPNYDVQALAAGTHIFDVRLVWYGGTGGAYLSADPVTFAIKDLGPA